MQSRQQGLAAFTFFTFFTFFAQLMLFVLFVLFVFFALSIVPARAQSAAAGYPAKPVRYVVAFAAGDAPDIVARLMGEVGKDRLKLW